MSKEKQQRLNVTLSKEDEELIKTLKIHLNKELMMELSNAQVIRRLLRQATASLIS